MVELQQGFTSLRQLLCRIVGQADGTPTLGDIRAAPIFSDTHWREPLKWNQEAGGTGRRERVFCASMADVFERRLDLNAERRRLWELIERTQNLDWLLLTKRPQNVERMVPWRDNWPANVWLGTTVENQMLAEKRLPFLLRNPASVRFLSCEPLLGQLNLRPWFRNRGLHPIDWVIAGGESGSKSRPMHPDWALNLLQQCQEFDVPFHFKQWATGHLPNSWMKLLNRSYSRLAMNDRLKWCGLARTWQDAFLRELPGMGTPQALHSCLKLICQTTENRDENVSLL